jgi:hypothetical protein
MKLHKNHLLFLTILLEGYVVLATELLAIRLLIPFVGSGTEVIAIIISCVLLPLAVGYHVGGRRYSQSRKIDAGRNKQPVTVRTILIKNLFSSLLILLFGLSYLFLELFFSLLVEIGITHHIAKTLIYGTIFLVYPTYLLAQTVPLISNYFSEKSLSEITGKMLFYSTTGSFFGSIVSTLVLMTTIGVHNTVIVTLAMLVALIFLLSRGWFNTDKIFALMLLGLAFAINGDSTMKEVGVIYDNNYNTVMVNNVAGEVDSRVLVLNRSASSKYSPDPSKRYPYLQYLETVLVNHFPKEGKPLDVLVIGAGGFSFGMDDTFNRYTYVDIDPKLKDMSEQYFLKKPLSQNKQFIPSSARAYLQRDANLYDVIFIDVFTNVISIPFEATTHEFLLAVKKRLRSGGVVAVNIISKPTFADRFTVRYNNTFRSVFPVFDRYVVGGFNAFSDTNTDSNTLYFYYDTPFAKDSTIYTDDKSTYSLDRR